MSKKTTTFSLNKILLTTLVFLLIAGSVILLLFRQQLSQKINSLMILIEFERIEGIEQWEKELDARGITALVKVQDNVLKEYPEVFKRLANKGYEIAGGYDSAPFWDMDYDEQYRLLAESKELVESITGKEMRVFGSRYFAYDENTLKAADELGIEYILARGTQDVDAVIYAPDEYDVKIISVTNVDSGEMGRGSLCDYSLWARGSSVEDFAVMIEESILKQPEDMILVSHAYLGGTRQEWWNEYQFILADERLSWQGFDDWLANHKVIELPNSEISINREVKYVEPAPVKPIEEFEAVPGLQEEFKINEEELVIFHNGSGPMCLEALNFFNNNDLEYSEHLTSEGDFRSLLQKYQAEYPTSIGVSEAYQFLPIIFYRGQAYSGFNSEIASQLK